MEAIPENYRKDRAVIADTVKQINKDLASEGISLILSGNDETAFDELRQQLIPIVENLIKNKKLFFQSLMYTVDISEKDLRDALHGDGDRYGRVAELIIRREFQKVLTRRFFSK